MKTRFFVATHAFIKNNEGKYLITKRSNDNDYMPDKWDTPGGTIEPGETPVDALFREVNEETGASIINHKLDYIFTNFATLPNSQYFIIVFTCDLNQSVNDIQIDSEHSEYKWVDFDEIFEYDIIPFLQAYIIFKAPELSRIQTVLPSYLNDIKVTEPGQNNYVQIARQNSKTSFLKKESNKI